MNGSAAGRADYDMAGEDGVPTDRAGPPGDPPKGAGGDVAAVNPQDLQSMIEQAKKESQLLLDRVQGLLAQRQDSQAAAPAPQPAGRPRRPRRPRPRRPGAATAPPCSGRSRSGASSARARRHRRATPGSPTWSARSARSKQSSWATTARARTSRRTSNRSSRTAQKPPRPRRPRSASAAASRRSPRRPRPAAPRPRPPTPPPPAAPRAAAPPPSTPPATGYTSVSVDADGAVYRTTVPVSEPPAAAAADADASVGPTLRAGGPSPAVSPLKHGPGAVAAEGYQAGYVGSADRYGQAPVTAATLPAHELGAHDERALEGEGSGADMYGEVEYDAGPGYGDGSNAGAMLYRRSVEWQKLREVGYDQKRQERQRGEMTDCTFSPSINRKSKAIAKTGVSYPAEKWSRKAPVTTPPKPRPPPQRATPTRARNLGGQFSRAAHSPRRELEPPDDVATEACLRLYAYAQDRDRRIKERAERLHAAEEAALQREHDELVQQSTRQLRAVPSRWRQPTVASQGGNASPMRPTSAPAPPPFRPDVSTSQRSWDRLQRKQAGMDGIDLVSRNLGDLDLSGMSSGAPPERRNGNGDPTVPGSVMRTPRGTAVSPGREDVFRGFLQRQYHYLDQTSSRRKQREAEAEQREGVELAPGTKRILQRRTVSPGRPTSTPQGGVGGGEAEAGRTTLEQLQNIIDEDAVTPAPRGVPLGLARFEPSPGRARSPGRKTAPDEPTFKPKINARSQRLPGRSHQELYEQRKRLEHKRELQRAHREAEQMAGVTFSPRLIQSRQHKHVSGRLRINEDPTAYLERATAKIRAEERARDEAALRKYREETAGCTFKPVTTGVPEYVLRIARARHTREADGMAQLEDPEDDGPRWR
ncbi:unnamed protein product [Pedinophyceae sp. YPF-701]|nr:unnamed protein product [Pedinophyceae sp. YPF-701]